MLTITEAGGQIEAPRGNRMLIRLIDAGVGSSGIYPPETLRRAAEEGVFAKGLHLFADHPGEAERYDRPERSIRDIAGALTENARFDEATNALVAEAKTFGPWTEILREMSDDIGLSIRAGADTSEGQHDGQPARIIERITSAVSVDFVTRAGRGGRVLQLLESSTVREALNQDLETAFARALTSTRPEGYVVDFDDAAKYVIYSEGPKYYRQDYSSAGDPPVVTLIGVPTEVQREVRYVSVPTPVGQQENDNSGEDKSMTQLEEAQARDLAEVAGRVQELTEANAALTAEREALIAARDEARAIARTAAIEAAINSSEVDFTTLERKALVLGAPVSESGELDTEALQAAITEAATEAAARTNSGAVKGMGEAGVGVESDPWASIDRDLGIAQKVG